MNKQQLNRRKFISNAVKTSAGLMVLPAIALKATTHVKHTSEEENFITWEEPRIKFSVIGINHRHIYGMVAAVMR